MLLLRGERKVTLEGSSIVSYADPGAEVEGFALRESDSRFVDDESH
jgi:hypothetical protein